MEKNNKLWLGILIGVLASLVVGLVGYIVYDKVLSNDVDEVVDTKDDFKNNDNNDKEQVVIIDLSLDNSKVKNLSDKVIGVYTNNMMTSYEDYFYKKDRIAMSEEDMSFKLSLAAETVSGFFGYDETNYDCNTGICGISFVSEELIKDAYFDLFGKEAYYERASFSVATCQGRDGYTWSQENNRYESEVSGGCGDAVCGGSESKLGYAKQIISSDIDKIELYEYFYYVQCLDDGEGSNIYSDYNKTNLIHVGYLNSEEVFSKYKNQLGQYKYTFEKDKYGTYVFTSVEKVK